MQNPQHFWKLIISYGTRANVSDLQNGNWSCKSSSISENLLSLIVQEQIWEISNTAMGHANLQYFWILMFSYWTEQMWDLWNGNGSCKSSIFLKTHHLTVRSVLSLYNPQTTETNFCEKYEVGMLKIIIIMIGYTLNNFFTQMIIDHGKK